MLETLKAGVAVAEKVIKEEALQMPHAGALISECAARKKGNIKWWMITAKKSGGIIDCRRSPDQDIKGIDGFHHREKYVFYYKAMGHKMAEALHRKMMKVLYPDRLKRKGKYIKKSPYWQAIKDQVAAAKLEQQQSESRESEYPETNA